MNKNQENWLSMSLSVKEFCAQLSAIFTLIPGFPALLTLLETTIKEIQDLAIIQMTEYKGKAALKKVLKQNLVGLSMQLVRAMIAYAQVHELIDLYNTVSYTESKLKKLSMVELKAVSTLIYEKADGLKDELDEYGITPEILAAQLTAINDYSREATAPRDAIIVRKNATMALKVCFKDGRQAIVKMDDLVDTIKEKNADAFNSYMNARIIVDYRKGKRNGAWYISGKAVDFETGYPAAGVSISIVGTSIVMITQLDGLFELRVPGPGQYSLRGEHPNYRINLREVTLIGETSEIVMEMERAAEE
jgi:hypothetical protein